tara:strand:+ start:2188 stop:2334 length:147 start_codon:yes stop_codon:yes gene_type:complete
LSGCIANFWRWRGKLDAEGVRDLNAAQAVVLYHIGEDDVTVGALTNRG